MSLQSHFASNKPEAMTWHDALRRLVAQDLVTSYSAVEGETALTQVYHDSRCVEPGGCFVAIKGEQTDGHFYVEAAIAKGASAVVCERPLAIIPPRMPYAVVDNGRRALAELSAAVQKDPSNELHMTGITGTNGKTTTSGLVHHVFEQTGTSTGLLGTVAYATASGRAVRVAYNPGSSQASVLSARNGLQWMHRMRDGGVVACLKPAPGGCPQL